MKKNDKMKQRRLRTFVKIVLYPFILKKKKNYRCLILNALSYGDGEYEVFQFFFFTYHKRI